MLFVRRCGSRDESSPLHRRPPAGSRPDVLPSDWALHNPGDTGRPELVPLDILAQGPRLNTLSSYPMLRPLPRAAAPASSALVGRR